jgi:hypothetical protein
METSNQRDYSTISSSAKALLYLKGYTNIPFARQAATLMMQPEKYEPDFANGDFLFWSRVVHFESRYWSINQLLADLRIKNILELSSGFSFRGLEAIAQDGVHYIDTDLPGVIETKAAFVQELQPHSNPKSKLEILPLNALDEKAFMEMVSRFPQDEPVVIVNEGLLMYLSIPEKEQLCRIIRKMLEERGGYWITADIYLKQRNRLPDMKLDDNLAKFFEQHHVRDNMFDSFEQAENFFGDQGFTIDKKATPDREKLSTLPYLLKSASPDQLKLLGSAPRIQQTWRM